MQPLLDGKQTQHDAPEHESWHLYATVDPLHDEAHCVFGQQIVFARATAGNRSAAAPAAAVKPILRKKRLRLSIVSKTDERSLAASVLTVI